MTSLAFVKKLKDLFQMSDYNIEKMGSSDFKLVKNLSDSSKITIPIGSSNSQFGGKYLHQPLLIIREIPEVEKILDKHLAINNITKIGWGTICYITPFVNGVSNDALHEQSFEAGQSLRNLINNGLNIGYSFLTGLNTYSEINDFVVNEVVEHPELDETYVYVSFYDGSIQAIAKALIVKALAGSADFQGFYDRYSNYFNSVPDDNFDQNHAVMKRIFSSLYIDLKEIYLENI